MKIPKKKELQELQKKYHTDKKIGEVYGVPARLVAYWRSKKNIGAYNLPKYSREKIVDLWERYGDDRLAGRELGISGPGFRRWRKMYTIIKKPAQLKMEQLELGLLDSLIPSKTSKRETFARKIFARAANLKKVEIGQSVELTPDLTFAVDNAGSSIEHFHHNGYKKVWDGSRITVILNHLPMSENDNHADKQKTIRDFVKKQNIANFFDIGWGISHQVVFEEGLMLPGQMGLSTDFYAGSPGCVGAFCARVKPVELADIWANGRVKLNVPKTLKVTISGHLARGVSSSDAFFKISKELIKYKNENLAVEFHGSAVTSMSISQRFNLVNLAIETGAFAAVVPYDDVTQRYVKKVTKAKFKPVKSDIDAEYDYEIESEISYLTPHVICPNSFKRVSPIEEITGKKIDHVVLGGFTHGLLDDLEIAAKILRGRRIHRNTRMLVIPGSRKTYLKALDLGFIRTFIESGCLVLSPSYASCMGANLGMVAAGEKALTTSKAGADNGNGTKKLEIYVASPATAAATALNGAITDPRKYLL